MMDTVLALLGHWTWWIVAALLLIGELLIPGVFLLWFGLAAAVVGAITLTVPMAWELEIFLFAAISVVLVGVARPWLKKRQDVETDQPNLNRRAHGFIGKEYVLHEAIVDGRGRLKINDSFWIARGHDRAKGKWVRVVGVDDQDLLVEPVDKP